MPTPRGGFHELLSIYQLPRGGRQVQLNCRKPVMLARAPLRWKHSTRLVNWIFGAALWSPAVETHVMTSVCCSRATCRGALRGMTDCIVATVASLSIACASSDGVGCTAPPHEHDLHCLPFEEGQTLSLPLGSAFAQGLLPNPRQADGFGPAAGPLGGGVAHEPVTGLQAALRGI